MDITTQGKCEVCGNDINVDTKEIETEFSPQDENPIDYVLNTYILEHHRSCDEIAKLLDDKRHDYGTDNIRKFGTLGCLIRASDKIERLINLQNKEPNFESLEDTWKDIAGYAILGLIELRAGR